jgi:SPP1 family predicted phage head-tail adaptor
VGESTVGTRHCRIRPLKTEEIFEAQQVDEQITHEVTMRYDSTLAALKGRETWIEQGDRRFEIVGSKIDVMEGHRLIRFQCRERQ